ncbi:MAG TPA: oxidoreductase C-terminal domain-containing protein, partial [Actinomycetales bacterium]
DEHLRAVGADDVYAVGDVARWHNPRYDEQVRLEHWSAAGDQARCVAATLTGTPTACDALPYVWTEQHGRRLQVYGRIRAHDEIRFVVGGPDDDAFVALAIGDGALQGAAALDQPKVLLRYRKLLRRSASLEEVLELC